MRVSAVSTLRLRFSAPAVVFIVRSLGEFQHIWTGTNLLTPPNVAAEPLIQRSQARPPRHRTVSFSSQLCAESHTFQRAQINYVVYSCVLE